MMPMESRSACASLGFKPQDDAPLTQMKPDTACVGLVCPSPNYGARIGFAAPDSIVLHYTGMADGASALARLSDPRSQVSSHYLVEEDGAILQLVPESERAWHAGQSSWLGVTDMNSASVGIEIVNGGHDFGLPPFPERQVRAVAALVGDIMGRWAIPSERLLAHSDIAPGRKRDPGERFPWSTLAAAGLGHWVPEQTSAGASLKPGDEGPGVEGLQRGLKAYGYGLLPNGIYDEATRVVVSAFQLHFRPSCVDGIADATTRATLAELSRSLASAGVSSSPFRSPA